LLGRWAVRRYAPFAFSVTQTAIPAGILLGGWLAPPLAQSLGWRGTHSTDFRRSSSPIL
jgi:hypothetical protein